MIMCLSAAGIKIALAVGVPLKYRFAVVQQFGVGSDAAVTYKTTAFLDI
jgi:hypothetical protein